MTGLIFLGYVIVGIFVGCWMKSIINKFGTIISELRMIRDSNKMILSNDVEMILRLRSIESILDKIQKEK